MPKPDVSYNIVDNKAELKCYALYQDANDTFVYVYSLLTDIDSIITIEFGDSLFSYFKCNKTFDLSVYLYKINLDGSYALLRAISDIPSAYYSSGSYYWLYLNGSSNAYWPNSSNCKIFIEYPSDQHVIYHPKAGSTIIASESFVIWPSVPYQQNVYRTVLPEPVADLYNRYIVLSGPERSTLIWIGYRLSEQYTWETTLNNSTTEYALYNYLTPVWETYDYGMRLYITAPDYILQYQDIVGYPALIDLTVQITMYDLETGEYLGGAQKNVNGPITQSTSPIQIIDIVGSQSDNPEVTAIAVYGLMYRDISAYSHMHLANIVWSIDPDFDTWRSSVSDWLERIFNALDQTVDTSDVEISQDMAAITEYESARDALVVTGDNGQVINAAQDAQIQFEVIGSQVQQMAPQFSYQNNLVQQLLDIHPKLIILIVFALACSLIVIIFGRKLSSK